MYFYNITSHLQSTNYTDRLHYGQCVGNYPAQRLKVWEKYPTFELHNKQTVIELREYALYFRGTCPPEALRVFLHGRSRNDRKGIRHTIPHTPTFYDTTMDSKTQQTRQPVITKTVQTQRIGIQVYAISRYAIGYVMRGRKYIYYGDTRYEVKQGDLFYLDIGNHYIEDIPEEGKPYEQITLFYSPENLHEILTTLSINYQLEIDSTHSCSACDTDLSHVSYPAWNMVKHFFSNVNQYLKEDLFSEAPTAEKLKTTELVYLILSNPECCIKSRILNDANMAAEGFEQIIQQHIFDGLSTEELAALCHKNLTSFKKEFVKHFHEPPHKWFLKRRLTHSRLLLVSTNKSIADIASECKFTNTSHYIKLFKQEYGVTPAVYRNNQRGTTAKRHEEAEQELAYN